MQTSQTARAVPGCNSVERFSRSPHFGHRSSSKTLSVLRMLAICIFPVQLATAVAGSASRSLMGSRNSNECRFSQLHPQTSSNGPCDFPRIKSTIVHGGAWLPVPCACVRLTRPVLHPHRYSLRKRSTKIFSAKSAVISADLRLFNSAATRSKPSIFGSST